MGLRGGSAAFHSNVLDRQWASAVPTSRPWPQTIRVGEPLEGAIWLQAAEPVKDVAIVLDGLLLRHGEFLPYSFQVPTLQAGRHQLAVYVVATDGKLLLSKKVNFRAQ